MVYTIIENTCRLNGDRPTVAPTVAAQRINFTLFMFLLSFFLGIGGARGNFFLETFTTNHYDAEKEGGGIVSIREGRRI